MFRAEIKWGSHKSKHPDSWQQFFLFIIIQLNRNSALEGSSIMHLYPFISSWFNLVTSTTFFNFRWGQNFFWCQTGSRREPLSWLLHLLYIFITGLFSSCRVPTHMYKEENPHPPKHAAKIPYVHTSRPCTFHKSADDRDRTETRVCTFCR